MNYEDEIAFSDVA